MLCVVTPVDGLRGYRVYYMEIFVTAASGTRHEIAFHLDARTAALLHGVGHGSSGRVNERHETHESELVDREVDVVRVILVLRGEWRAQHLVGEACTIPI